MPIGQLSAYLRVFSILSIILLTVPSKSTCQIDFPDRQSLVEYLEGTWELKRIFGFGPDKPFPTATESYHYKYTPGPSDSTVIITLYRNHVWEEEYTATISSRFYNGYDTWEFDLFELTTTDVIRQLLSLIHI